MKPRQILLARERTQDRRVDKRSASTFTDVAGVDALRLSTLRQLNLETAR